MSVSKFINSLVNQNKDEAKSAFQTELADRVQSAFEVKKVEVASKILTTVEEETVNEISTELASSYFEKAKGDPKRKDGVILAYKKAHGKHVNVPTRNKGEPVDESTTDAMGNGVASHELVLYADNHAGLHRSSETPIKANLKKKVAKGTYDHEKAKTLWGYHADRAAMAYHKEFGSGGKWHEMFSKADRKAAASEFADNAKDELHE